MEQIVNHNSVVLISAVDDKIDSVRTRTLDISFNELLNMHNEKELIIAPDYQRLFRWSEGKQSRLIESLILEMPIPPIFVIELDEGRYELIDGLQRISSYLHFRGSLPSRSDDGQEQGFLILTDCDVASELNGLTYNDLPSALQIKLKRSFVRVEVIRKESDRRLRYYMFKRLNTGGEILSEQEIRNCTIRLLDDKFNNFLISLSSDANFSKCISSLSEDKLNRKYDQELVLRFFAFKNWRDNYKHDVGDFLSDYMEAVSDPTHTQEPFDYGVEEPIFRNTFQVLVRALDDHAFSRTNQNRNFVSGFIVYHYEAFTLGIQKHLDRLDPNDDQLMAKVRDVLIGVKSNPEFRNETTGGGKNYPNRLAARIQFVEDAVDTLWT